MESEPSSTPKLPLLISSNIPHPNLELPSGMLTPPLQTSASVPFRWEEEPGKPRPCTTLITLPPPTHQKSLDLPPRLLLINKTPSPTTVLDGPDPGAKSVFSSSSFRFFSRERRRQGSFDSSSCSSRSPPQEKEQKGSRGLFGSFRLGSSALKINNAKRGNFVISSSSSSMEIACIEDSIIDDDNNTGGKKNGKRMKRNGSFSSRSHVTRAHFWASIYKGFKQFVPWKDRKSKKEGLTI